MIDVNNKIYSFQDLQVWQEGHKLVLLIYKMSSDFDKSEIFGLTSQIRRAAVSITSNIAEGFSRYSYADKGHFYIMARGSLTEVQNQLIIAKDINYINDNSYKNLFEQSVVVNKLING